MSQTSRSNHLLGPRQFFYGFLAVVLLLVGGGLAAWLLATQRIGQDIDKLERAQADLVIADEQLKELIALGREFNEVRPLSQRVDEILPAEKAQSEATAELATITAGLGIPLNGLTYDTTTALPSATSQTAQAAVGGVSIMSVNFTTTVTYGQLQALLGSIEDNLRHMQVNQISIAESDGLLSVNLIVDIYLKT